MRRAAPSLVAVMVLSIVCVLGIAEVVVGQYTGAPPIGSTPIAPPPAKDDPAPVQHGAQPNPGEVRPSNQAGDSPSAAAGALRPREQVRRIFGLPVTAALVIAGVLIALSALAVVLVPRARRRQQARGGGTYGRAR